MVRRIEVPDSIAKLDLLSSITYEDAHEARVREGKSAEEWFTLALDGAPRWIFGPVRAVQTSLGLELQPDSPEHPIGWNVLKNEPNLYVLGVDGRNDSARLVALLEDGRLTVATQVQFSRRARALWFLTQGVHRAILRTLMSKGVRSSDARTVSRP